MKIMNDCTESVAVAVELCTTTAVPYSSTKNDNKNMRDQHLRRIMSSSSNIEVKKSAINNDINHVEFDHINLPTQRIMVRHVPAVMMMNMGYGMMGRSYSVGLGEIGTIDEDKPSTFHYDHDNLSLRLRRRNKFNS
ncbi:hypothetical protein CsatB_005965 [Cannabis sativa]